MFSIRALTCIVVAMGLTVSASGVEAGEREDITKRAVKAADVLTAMIHAPDKEIPRDLLAKAHAVAVIPNVVKGAFIFGGRWGKGLVAARTDGDEWGTPAFVEVHGGNFGIQAGVEATDLILIFTEPDGLQEMLKDNLKLGVEAGAVAGPVGREVGASSNFTFDSPIYAYSRNKGLFAGVSLDGTVISIDDSANHEAYGAGVTGTDIVVRKSVELNDVTRPFHEALVKLVPRRDPT